MSTAVGPDAASTPRRSVIKTTDCFATFVTCVVITLILNARSIGRAIESNNPASSINVREELVPRSAQDQNKRCDSVIFLHVGKNGGTTVDKFFQTYGRSFAPKRCCGHKNILGRLPASEANSTTCYVTLVRDPIERWVSGYLSRFRSGCPAHCNRRPDEEWVWSEFPTPNHLAEAFSSSNISVKARSLQANRRIVHLRKTFAHYLPDLEAHVDKLIYVGKTCTLDEDLLPLALAVANVQRSVSSKTVRAAVKSFHSRAGLDRQHENDVKALEYISPLARENLKLLLREDFAVLKSLKEHGLILTVNISAACEKAHKFSTPNAVQKEDWLDFIEHNYSRYRANLMKMLSKS